MKLTSRDKNMAGNKLLVVIDPLTDDQMALGRAVKLALEINASLHLFCCTYLSEDELLEYSSRKDAKHSQVQETKDWLQELAQPIKNQGLEVSCEVVWNQRWEMMVAQAAGRVDATLIVKSSFQHSALSRKFKHTSDFYLMRAAPCPVLLVKSDEAWQNSIILAAVSLNEHEPEHDVLNNRILTQAQRLAKATGFELHLVSAIEKTPNFVKLFHLLEHSEAPDQQLAAERFGIPSANMHLREGKAKAVITDLTQELHADLLVIGTAARAGVQATLVGNTAEKILDKVETDVMVVG
ncbi:universal stress protein UspE [Simiduia litorea]